MDDPAPSSLAFHIIVHLSVATHVFSHFIARAHFISTRSPHTAHSRLPTPHCPLINRVTVRRAAWRPACARGGARQLLLGFLGFVRSFAPRVPLPGSLVRRHDVVHVHPSQARRHHRPVDLPWSALHAALRNGALLPASGLLLQPARRTAARGCYGMGDVGFEPNARHRQRHGAAAGCCILAMAAEHQDKD